MLPQRKHGVHHLAVVQLEIPHIGGHVQGSRLAHEAIEQRSGGALENRFPLAAAALAVHDVVPLFPFFNHQKGHFGRVLQVGVHRDDGVSRRFRKAAQKRRLLPEIAGKVAYLHALVPPRQAAENFFRPVPAAVVYENYFKFFPQGLHQRHHRLIEQRERFFLVIRRHDQRIFNHKNFFSV